MDILRGSTCPEQKILYNMSNPCRSHILLQPHNQARIFSQTYKERNKMYWSLFPIQCVPGSNWLHKRWQHGGDVRDVCDVLSQCPRAVVDCPNMVSALSLTSSIQRCIFYFNKLYVNFFFMKNIFIWTAQKLRVGRGRWIRGQQHQLWWPTTDIKETMKQNRMFERTICIQYRNPVAKILTFKIKVFH